MDLLLSILT